MSRSNWVRRLVQSTRNLFVTAPSSPRRRSHRPMQVEALEDRWTPTVTSSIPTWGGPLVISSDAAGDYVSIERSTLYGYYPCTTIRTFSSTTTVFDSAFSSIQFQMGDGDDYVHVKSVAAGRPITLENGGGNDDLVLGDYGRFDGVLSAVTAQGTAGLTNLRFSGSGHTNNVSGIFDSFRDGTGAEYGTVKGLTPALVTYAAARTRNVIVDTGSGNDAMFLFSSVGNVHLNTGAGGDVLYTSSTHLGDSPRAIWFNAGEGSDTTWIIDEGAPDGRSYLVDDATIEVAGRLRVGSWGAEWVYAVAGTGNDTMQVKRTPAGQSLVLNGGGGNDTLAGPDQNTTYTINDMNQGTLASSPWVTPALAGPVNFYNIGSLRGGAGNDSFVFQTARYGGWASAPSLTGTIDGGAGGNGLNYWNYGDATTGVTVNLPLGRATAVAGGIAGIRDVCGSAGSNLIVGDDQANDLMVPWSSYGRNVLIGGGGADTLRGNMGGDLIVAGRTSFDRDAVTLNAIKGAWVNSMPVTMLNATTVFNDGAADWMSGGGAADMFFTSVGDTIWTYDTSDDQIVVV